MNLRSKHFLIVLIFLVTVTILRENGILNIHFYTSEITTNTKLNLVNNEVIMSVEKSGLDSIKGGESYQDLRIKIVAITSDSANNDFDFVIKEKSIPTSFIPLHANLNYKITATINDEVRIYKTDIEQIHLLKNAIKGEVSVEGQFKSTGLVSNYEIKKLILKKFTESIHQEFKKYLETH